MILLSLQLFFFLDFVWNSLTEAKISEMMERKCWESEEPEILNLGLRFRFSILF